MQGPTRYLSAAFGLKLYLTPNRGPSGIATGQSAWKGNPHQTERRCGCQTLSQASDIVNKKRRLLLDLPAPGSRPHLRSLDSTYLILQRQCLSAPRHTYPQSQPVPRWD